ncbi:MAG TPA: FAD-dependent oxidoreductase [Candidatus Magasanikbacteria bacterium]|nr:FAD-dependent oxidoreductase [Candidatus Magasanikbacteria bacterium]
MNRYKTTILSKKTIAENIIELRLDKPKNFEFQAGQFIQIIAPSGEKHVFRSYSISSTPQDKYLELCIKIYETGIASKLLKNASIGEEITLRGPAGRFTSNAIESDIYCIATGVGIAPIMGILRDQLENKSNKQKLHLIFGVRYEKDIFWTDRLDELQRTHANFTYSLTLSQPEDSWTGLRGRVSEHLPENTSNLHVFLCGSADMVATVREMCVIRGTDTKNVHFEIF